MVAKSYQNLKILCEPYTLKNRQYVRVLSNKGVEKVVRWYTDAEYKKLYGETVISITSSTNSKSSLKDTLGFTKGYITIFKGNTYSHLDWFKSSICRFTRWWGWYIISTDELPSDIPSDLTPVKLAWPRISKDDNTLLDENTIKSVIEDLKYSASDSTSNYVGTVGERLDLHLTLMKAIELEWGTLYEFVDDCNNVYVWGTASKSLTVGDTYYMRGTVKCHKEYHKVKQTILTRCRVK